MSDAVISYSDFEKIKMATGTIISVKINPKARKPAYILEIDFGDEIGVKTSSAQITNYSVEDLINKQIIAVINFDKKNSTQEIKENLKQMLYSKSTKGNIKLPKDGRDDSGIIDDSELLSYVKWYFNIT